MLLLLGGAGARRSANVAAAMRLRDVTSVRSIQADGLDRRNLQRVMSEYAARRNVLRSSRDRGERARGDRRWVSTVLQNVW